MGYLSEKRRQAQIMLNTFNYELSNEVVARKLEWQKQIAEMIHERHELLTEWLVHLGVPETIASDDACKLEHVLSKESFEAIKKHLI